MKRCLQCSDSFSPAGGDLLGLFTVGVRLILSQILLHFKRVLKKVELIQDQLGLFWLQGLSSRAGTAHQCHEKTSPPLRRTPAYKPSRRKVKLQSKRRNSSQTESWATPADFTANRTGIHANIAESTEPHSHGGTPWKRRRNLRRMFRSEDWSWKSLRQDVRRPGRKRRPRPAAGCWSGARWVLAGLALWTELGV